MPRAKVARQFDFPLHVGGRCINREWFNIPMDDVWNIMSEQLLFIHHAFAVKTLAFVLMSNHFHLIVRTPGGNLSEAMCWFMRETSRALTRAGNRINMTWGGPHFRSVIGTPHYFLNAYKYVYHNPIAAGICDDVLSYPYSTLPGLLGRQSLLVPVDEDLTLFCDVGGTLDWLNTKPNPEYWEVVGRALKKREFKLSKIDSRPHPLEFERL